MKVVSVLILALVVASVSATTRVRKVRSSRSTSPDQWMVAEWDDFLKRPNNYGDVAPTRKGDGTPEDDFLDGKEQKDKEEFDDTMDKYKTIYEANQEIPRDVGVYTGHGDFINNFLPERANIIEDPQKDMEWTKVDFAFDPDHKVEINYDKSDYFGDMKKEGVEQALAMLKKKGFKLPDGTRIFLLKWQAKWKVEDMNNNFWDNDQIATRTVSIKEAFKKGFGAGLSRVFTRKGPKPPKMVSQNEGAKIADNIALHFDPPVVIHSSTMLEWKRRGNGFANDWGVSDKFCIIDESKDEFDNKCRAKLTALHELGHVLHRVESRAKFWDLSFSNFKGEAIADISSLSGYTAAKNNPREFVAEMFVAKMVGYELNDEKKDALERYYESLGGPEFDESKFEEEDDH